MAVYVLPAPVPERSDRTQALVFPLPTSGVVLPEARADYGCRFIGDDREDSDRGLTVTRIRNHERYLIAEAEQREVMVWSPETKLGLRKCQLG